MLFNFVNACILRRCWCPRNALNLDSDVVRVLSDLYARPGRLGRGHDLLVHGVDTGEIDHAFQEDCDERMNIVQRGKDMSLTDNLHHVLQTGSAVVQDLFEVAYALSSASVLRAYSSWYEPTP